MRLFFLTTFFLIACIFSGSVCMAISSEYTVDSHTVGLWHLNENTGNTISDTAGNNTGVLVGNLPPIWTSGKFLGGLHLSGCYNTYADQCGAIELPTGLLNIDNSIFEMYVNYDYRISGPNPAESGFVGYLFYDGANTFARVYIDTSNPARYYGRVVYGVFTNSGWLEVSTPHEFSLDAGVWTHLAFLRQWDGIDTTIAIFVDGQLAVKDSRSSAGVLSGGQLYIGNTKDNGVSFGGKIDEIRLSDSLRPEYSLSGNGNCGPWGYVVGDFDHNCYVDLADLNEMASQWLLCSSGLSTDLYINGCIDFQDFAVLAGNMGGCTVANETNCVDSYDRVIRFENTNYLCEIFAGSGGNDLKGLRWGRIREKLTNSDCLFSDGNGPIFMVFGDGLSVDSTDFTVTDISSTSQGEIYSKRITMDCSASQLRAVLDIKSDETEKMLWSLDIENTSTMPRRVQPVFPVMERINIGGLLEQNKYFYPWRGGIVGDIDCKLRCEYGNLGWMQVISVFNPNVGAGLYTYPKDSTGTVKGMPFKKVYNSAEPTVVHSEVALHRERPHLGDPATPVELFDELSDGIAYAYYYTGRQLSPGESFVMPETVVAVCNGGWKEALTDYSQWAHTWYTHVETPDWFSNSFNSVGAHPGYYYSEAQGEYSRSQGMDDPDPMHLEQWAFWWDYSDFDNPFVEAGDFYYNQDRGGLIPFKDEIQAIQAKGTRVSLYIDDAFCWQHSDIGQQSGQQWAQMSSPGVYTEWGGPEHFYRGCFYEPNAWTQYIANTCQRVVSDTGVDAIYLDEMPLLFPCYNSSHQHYSDQGLSFSVDKMVDYIQDSRNAILSANPDGVLYTEHAGSDYFTQFFDGSWDQTFYDRFDFSQNYYDDYSISYFRFCFPEFKLLYWGDNEDKQARAFFSGVGICDYPLTGYQKRAGQVMKENGDGFASLTPEPIVPTYVDNILANKFPVENKVLYTVYNKTVTDYTAQPVMKVDHKPGYHYVELYEDSNFIEVDNTASFDELTFTIASKQVLCIAQLPQIIETSIDSGILNLSLTEYQGDETLVVFWNYDNSVSGFQDAEIIDIVDSAGQITIPDWLGNGKVIIKLFRNEILLDEVVLGGSDVSGSGDIAIWNMNQGSGSVCVDSLGGDNNLQMGSQFYWTSSVPENLPGYAISTPYYNNTYCSGFINPGHITDKLTVSAWVRPASIDPDGSYIISMDQKFMLRIANDRTTVQFLVFTSDFVWQTVSAQPLGSSVEITDGQWHHIAGVYDGIPDSNGNANLYLYWDGNVIATASVTAAPEDLLLLDNGKGDVNVGASSSGSETTNYNGALDEIKVSNILITVF